MAERPESFVPGPGNFHVPYEDPEKLQAQHEDSDDFRYEGSEKLRAQCEDPDDFRNEDSENFQMPYKDKRAPRLSRCPAGAVRGF